LLVPIRREHDHQEPTSREVKVDLPHFHGKEVVKAYLDWEMKVEQLYECHHVSEERNVSLSTLTITP